MVRLQVDVDAANARRAFEQASRAVDDLGDELTQAQIDALRLEDAMDDTAREAARLRAEVARLGAGASDQLRNDLLEAERAALRARSAFAAADAEVDRLARSLDEAEDEADSLRRELDRLDADAGRSIRGVQRRLLGLAQAARLAGGNVGRSFAATAGPAMIGAIAVLGPPIAAALSSVLLAAIGGGVMAAAVAIALKESDALQRAFGRTTNEMGADVKRFAMGFEDELFAVSDRLGRAWDRISDDLSNAFEKAQKFVEPLADGLAGLVENMVGGGGFNEAMDAAGPVVAQLGVGLDRLGGAFNSFFESLADGGDGATKGMILLMDMLAGSVIVLGNTLEFLSKGFDFYTDAAEDYSAVMAGMLGWIPGVGDAWKFAAEKTGMFNDEANKTRSIVPILGVEVDETGKALDKQAAAAQKAAREAQNLSNKLHQLISDQMGAQQAAIAWEQAIDDITASFQENGRSIDISTQKGRENVQAVLAAVQAAEQKRQAAIDLAGGEKASADAVNAANAAFRAQLDQLAAILRQAGLTEAQISQLLSAYRALAAAPDITKRITYRVSATGPAGLVSAAQQSGSYSSGIGGRAKGGPVRAGMPYVVGEEGPELITPERDGYVHTAAQTARMLSGGPSGDGGSRGGRAATAATWSGSMTGLEAMFYRFLQGAIRTGKLKLA